MMDPTNKVIPFLFSKKYSCLFHKKRAGFFDGFVFLQIA